ncbi:glycosyltransferase involved in cell wall biosynthesis [Arcticibacter tournemirensis]|uniref:Glycosyltransferase family 1 protein n=1 Tax=Arcticibacter tournemirensis TaxID=699437 RepID=A0A5M9H4S3_9SPHI|nr:glycosyltransferase family 1 protein [Arcticibacter tournemirensis]KAA8481932.1 glycosyltransferase family 1 protein [Arcticibacter tournemirensis]TQM52268.1 glycosyltransferase involved in cell wall biosynthesis [Arcticibacter tournemirensis]
MTKIKVAFFAEILIEDFDGASRTMFQIIKRIPSEEFEFLFICGTGPDQLYGFDCIRMPTITLPVNHTYKMALPALAQNRLKTKLQAFAPDIIHIATPSILGNFGLKYARRRQIPVISIYHTHFISYIDYYFKHAPFLISTAKSLVADSQKSFYNQCDLVYVPSESISSELVEMGINERLMKLWKRGLDANLFSPEKKNFKALHKITGNSDPCILFASRLVWEKNLETLFEIYDEITKEGLAVNLLIAGDGIARKACEQRMPQAFFLGHKGHQELAAIYASVDIFLFPSVSETYGNVVLEAMASGIPCVIADGGGSADFINHGVNGFKCEPYNAVDYAEKIEILLSDKTLRDRFITEGLALSRSCSWDQLVNIYFDDLKKLSEYHVLAAV